MGDPNRSFDEVSDVLRFWVESLYYHGGLVGIGAALFLPMFGIGRALGAPYLYWHDSMLTQATVGLVVGLVYWHLGTVAYTLAVAEPGAVPETEGDRAEARRFIHWVGVPMLVVLTGLSLVTCRITDVFATGLPPHNGWPWIAGLFVSYLITLQCLRLLGDEDGGARGARRLALLDRFVGAIWRAGHRLIRWVDRTLARLGFDANNRPNEQLERFDHVNEQRRRVIGLMIFFSLGMLVSWLGLSLASWVTNLRALPAALPYCITLSLIAGLYGVVRVVIWRLTLPVLLALCGFCLWQWQQFPNGTQMPSNCAAADDPHACAAAWAEVRSVREHEAPLRDRLVDDDAALAAQLAARPGPVVVITTSGGGIRSAAWTVAVFDRLLELDPEFFAHVRIVTGASGGMVGAAEFLSAFGSAELGGGATPQPGALFCAASTSSLYAPLADLMFFTPGSDRGEALERAWEAESPAFARPLRSLAPLEAAAALPSMVFAPMLIEDGSQMLMSNLDLGWYALADQTRAGIEPDCSSEAGLRHAEGACGNARQFFARVPGDAVKISTVARVGASFPWLSPAVTLPFAEHPRAIDAGYYDNYGTKLAVAWITRHTIGCTTAKPGACLGDRPILLLELRDHDPEIWREPGTPRSIFHELSSPIEGLFKAQLHVANHRNAASVDHLLSVLGGQLEHVVLHFDGEASLSWELTAFERNELWNRAQSEYSWPRLRDWWRAHRPGLAATRELERPSCLD